MLTRSFCTRVLLTTCPPDKPPDPSAPTLCLFQYSCTYSKTPLHTCMLTYVKLQATSSASDSVQLLPYAHEPVPPASFHLPDAPRKNRSVVPCWYTGIRPLHSTTSVLPPDFHRLHAPVIHLVVVPFHVYASSDRTEKNAVQSHNRELHRICITSSIRKTYC